MLGLVTADAAAPLDPDLVPLTTALRARLGDDAIAVVSWDDASVDWAAFDAVVIRSTWDYTERLDEFLSWVEHVDSVSRLLNAPDVIRWNTDKHYLAELESLGVPIVPTTYVAPGEAAPEVSGVHVVKPTVGAGSSGARRCEPHEVADHVAALHRDGFTAMIQPYLSLLDERGETEHCFIVDGGAERAGLTLSHAFRKGAILVSTTFEQEGGLFAKEDVSLRVPSPPELALATRVLATDAVQRLGDIVFARVDVAPFADADGNESFVLMELELVEPSFYFHLDDGSVDRFADSLLTWLEARGLCAAS